MRSAGQRGSQQAEVNFSEKFRQKTCIWHKSMLQSVRCCSIRSNRMRGEKDERRNPSGLLSGNGNVQLWKYLCHRFYEEGYSR